MYANYFLIFFMSDGEAFYPRARILVSMHSECMDHEKDFF